MRATDAESTDGHPSRRTSAQSGRRGSARRRVGRPGTVAEILAAALSLFAERGYAGACIRAGAAGAGVDPAPAQHYFGTKEGLFRARLGTPIDPDELVAAATRVQLAASQLIGLLMIRTVVGMDPLASLTTAQLTGAGTPSVARDLQGESAGLDLGNVATSSRTARRSTTP